MGLFNLLISMHLESHKAMMDLTQNEYILPLFHEDSGSDHKRMNHYSVFEESAETAFEKFHKIPSMQEFMSIRPVLLLDQSMNKDIGRSVSESETGGSGGGSAVTRNMLGTAPPFPLTRLKDIILRQLLTAVNLGSHIRDPIGGTTGFLFV